MQNSILARASSRTPPREFTTLPGLLSRPKKWMPSPPSQRLQSLAVETRCLPRPTQPFIPPGSVNEYQLRLGRQRQVWFIPLAVEGGCTGNLPQTAVKQAIFELLLTSLWCLWQYWPWYTDTTARSLPTASLTQFSSITHTRLTIAAELHTVTTFAA